MPNRVYSIILSSIDLIIGILTLRTLKVSVLKVSCKHAFIAENHRCPLNVFYIYLYF